MNCSNCGATNSADQRFCDTCGSQLTADCPVCGHANRPGASFCGNCGNQLASGGAQPAVAVNLQPAGRLSERRLVSVLFADLVGFTPFAEERDAEQVRDVLERYFDAARAVIERHGGTVEKFIGDALMAVWGTPTAHEDDAERAVRAALELLPAVRTVDERLQARAAVLSGEAAVNLGAGNQGMLAGDLVNTAARLQSVAPPSTVLVGESTMYAASGAISFEPAGEQLLKGKQAPLPAWRALRIIAELGGRARSDAIEPPFVGRETELALLKDLLHATGREGRPRLVTVVGPAGIGKSRLGWELEKYLDGLVEPFFWHRGRSPSYGEGISFWALGEMVRRRCKLAEGDDEATTRERVKAAVADYVASDDDRLWVEPALLALLGVGEPPAGGREVLFAGWRIFFESIARRGTTVLLFEDLQFADSGLLDFIDHLLEWSRNSPLFVLCLTRPELLERRAEFGRATRHFTSMPLDPLPDEQMRALLAGLVLDLDEAAVETIVVRADGIPLYAVETVRMLIADGRLEASGDGSCRTLRDLGELAVPDTLRSLISSRLDALDSADRSLLQQAAVLGQSFSLEAVSGVSGEPVDELAARLRGLVRREILALETDPRSPERGQYRFVQGLIREVAYGTLSRRQRRERHLAAARHYETVGDEETAGALATHYLAAHHASEPGPEADAVATQARFALRAAAERAASLGAYGQAIGHLEQALDVSSEPSDRADLLERLARAGELDARYEWALDQAHAAVAVYRQLADRQGAARASGLVGTLLVNLARQGEAIEVYQAALREVPDDAPGLRAELAAQLARPLMRSKLAREAISSADEALDIAEPRGMTGVIAEALVNKGAALGFVGRWREGVVAHELGARLAREAGDNELHLRALNNLATTLSEDEPARSIEIAAEALALARRLGLRGMVNWLTGSVATGRYWLGIDWDGCVAMLRLALEDAGNDLDEGRLGAILLSFLFARGETHTELMARVVELIGPTDDPAMLGYRESTIGERLTAEGDLPSALEHFRRATELDPTDPVQATYALRAAIWLRDPANVGEFATLLDRVTTSGRVSTATRRWAEGAVAALDGRREAALRDLLESYRQLGELDMEFEAARVALDALILLPGESALLEPVEWARSKLTELGARPYLERLDLALAEAGVPAAG